MMEKWQVAIKKQRGFASKWYENTYASFGNKNQAGDMRNINLIDPSVMTQGRGNLVLTAGNQAGAVTQLIKSILSTAVSSNKTYAIGGALLHELSATAVTNTGNFPHTITGTGTITGEDVLHYKGQLLYSYNDSNTPSGNIGMFDLSSTFDGDWWTAVLGGGALVDAPHQMIHGGDDIAYIANGRYIATLDDTTDNHQALNFWEDAEVASISWNYNRLIIAVNRPNISGSNANKSAIYKWNGISSSWEGDPIEVNGRIGALFTKNGITYVWYEGFINGTVRLVFGMISGGIVVPIRTFSGTLPAYYQVSEFGEYVCWMSGQRLFVYGPLSGETPVDLFQLMSATYSTVGGIANPFGEIMISSDNGSSYNIVKENGYATDSHYYTLLFDTSGEGTISVNDKLVINFDKLATGARVDLTLRDNKGTALWTGIISFTGDGAITKKIFKPGVKGENVRLEYSFSSGSATNNVAIRNALIKGSNLN